MRPQCRLMADCRPPSRASNFSTNDCERAWYATLKPTLAWITKDHTEARRVAADELDVSETNELQSRAFHPPQGSLVDKAL